MWIFFYVLIHIKHCQFYQCYCNIFGRRVTVLSKKNKIHPFKDENPKDAENKATEGRLTSSFGYQSRGDMFNKLISNEDPNQENEENQTQILRRKTFSGKLNKLIHGEIKENENSNFQVDLIDNFIKPIKRDDWDFSNSEDNDNNNFDLSQTYNRRDYNPGSLYNDIMGFNLSSKENKNTVIEESKDEESKHSNSSDSDKNESNDEHLQDQRTSKIINQYLNDDVILVDHGVIIAAVSRKSK